VKPDDRKHKDVARQDDAEAPAERATGGVQSISRALSILDALAESETGLTLTVLSKRVALPPSSTHRLLTTMQRQRFVHFNRASMSWHVGVQAFVVGSAFADSCDVATLAKPHMRRLMEQTGETVNLYVFNEGGAVCMAQVQSPGTIRAISRPGGGLGMHRSASGKAMLSHMAKEEIAGIVTKHGMPRFTHNTIVSMEKLQADLATTRMRGFAVDDEEFALGLRCIAAPIFDEHGMAHAAISVAGPTARITVERVEALGGSVAAAARSVTAELGGVMRLGR
jgi:IclR family acetate operon transcriptional repressor